MQTCVCLLRCHGRFDAQTQLPEFFPSPRSGDEPSLGLPKLSEIDICHRRQDLPIIILLYSANHIKRSRRRIVIVLHPRWEADFCERYIPFKLKPNGGHPASIWVPFVAAPVLIGFFPRQSKSVNCFINSMTNWRWMLRSQKFNGLVRNNSRMRWWRMGEIDRPTSWRMMFSCYKRFFPSFRLSIYRGW